MGQGNDVVEMADVLRQDGKIYTVVFGLVIDYLTAMIILVDPSGPEDISARTRP